MRYAALAILMTAVLICLSSDVRAESSKTLDDQLAGVPNIGSGLPPGVSPELKELSRNVRENIRPAANSGRPIRRGFVLPPTGEDEYYAFQLIGLDVVEENGRELGTVADVIPGVANDVLEVGEHLLPMIEDCIRSVDLEAGRITVAGGFAD